MKHNPVVKRTGGIYHLRGGNIILNDMTITNWNSAHGVRVQKARYNRLVKRPVTHWCKNRGVTDDKSITILMFLKAHGRFDEVAIALDSELNYSLGNITAILQR